MPDESTSSLGRSLYRGATILAGLIVVLVAADFFYNLSIGEGTIPVMPLLIAALIWLTGWISFYLSRDH